MKIWRVELTVRGQSLAEVKTQRVIFQGDTLSALLFVIAMMPLNHILWKCTAGYKLSKSLADIKHFAKNEKSIRNSNTNCEYIHLRYRNGIWQKNAPCKK